jgi:predicted negative regulator of RcsB-dependent stress response
MTDLLDSVVEDLKQEKINKLIKRYFKPFIILTLIILISSFILSWWHSYKLNAIYAEGADYMKVQYKLHNVTSEQQLQEALKTLETLSKGKTVYAVIAALNFANIHDAMGNFNKAANLYEEIESNSNADNTIKSLATTLKVAARIRSEKFTNQEILNLLKLSSGNNHLNNLKQLLEASILIEDGKKTEAKAILEKIRTNQSLGQSNNLANLLYIMTK